MMFRLRAQSFSRSSQLEFPAGATALDFKTQAPTLFFACAYPGGSAVPALAKAAAAAEPAAKWPGVGIIRISRQRARLELLQHTNIVR